MKVIILSTTKYKEKDCIYNAISEDEDFSFQAKGAQDNKSPFVWLNNQLTVADVEFAEDGRYKHKLLKSATLKSSPFISGDEFNKLISVSAIAELTRDLLAEGERHLMFNEIINALDAIRSDKDILMVFFIYTARLIKQAGAQPNVDGCVACGNTHEIVAFSFAEGGFLCKHCVKPDTPRDLRASQMKLIRYLFRIKDYSCVKSEEYTRDDKLVVIRKFKEYIDDSLGVDVKSFDALFK